MNVNENPTIEALRHLDSRHTETLDKIDDFMRRQTNGENPDPAEFVRLLKINATTSVAMEEQFQLNDKPLKTVLAETR